MKVIITGATGYVGDGILRCCLEKKNIEVKDIRRLAANL